MSTLAVAAVILTILIVPSIVPYLAGLALAMSLILVPGAILGRS